MRDNLESGRSRRARPKVPLGPAGKELAMRRREPISGGTESTAGSWLAIDDIAARLRLSSKTVRRLIESERFPPPDVKLNSRVHRWREGTVTAWMAAQAVRGSR